MPFDMQLPSDRALCRCPRIPFYFVQEDILGQPYIGKGSRDYNFMTRMIRHRIRMQGSIICSPNPMPTFRLTRLQVNPSKTIKVLGA